MTFLFQFNNTLLAPWNHAQMNAFIEENKCYSGKINLPVGGITLWMNNHGSVPPSATKIKTFPGSSPNTGLRIIVWRLLQEGFDYAQGNHNSSSIGARLVQDYGRYDPRTKPGAIITVRSISLDITQPLGLGTPVVSATINILFRGKRTQYDIKAAFGSYTSHAIQHLIYME